MSKQHKVRTNTNINQGKNFKIDTTEKSKIDYPIFCFRHLHKDYDLNSCNDSEKKSLIEKIVTLSQLSWSEIQLSPRHGLGSEKISIGSIKPSLPAFITDDVGSLLSLRFDGKKPFIGLRIRFIFHVIYIDRNFSVYSH